MKKMNALKKNCPKNVVFKGILLHVRKTLLRPRVIPGVIAVASLRIGKINALRIGRKFMVRTILSKTQKHKQNHSDRKYNKIVKTGRNARWFTCLFVWLAWSNKQRC